MRGHRPEEVLQRRADWLVAAWHAFPLGSYVGERGGDHRSFRGTVKGYMVPFVDEDGQPLAPEGRVVVENSSTRERVCLRLGELETRRKMQW